MWPPGHLAVAYLVYASLARLRTRPPEVLPVLALGVGALFPDLVDKPLAWYLGVLPTGRTLAHSLLVLVPLCLTVYVLARAADRSELGVAFAVGAISHSLLDAVPALWGESAAATHLLWPLTPVETYEEGPPTVLGLLAESITDPYFLFEFVLLALALVIWYRDGLPGLGLLADRLGGDDAS